MRKKLISILLSLAMCLSFVPTQVFAEGEPQASDYTLTKDLTSLITKVELVGVEVGADGVYYVKANEPYSIELSFSENDNVEMDLTDIVKFTLPQGVVGNNATTTIDIGVRDKYYTSIHHKLTVKDNVVTIEWNKDSEFFEDLSHAHKVKFSFHISASFDGTVEEVKFGNDNETTIKVDNTGSITVNKNVAGLKNGVNVTTEDQKKMTFELRNDKGEVVKTFTYADMLNGSITYDEIKPGRYTVVETGRPEFANHHFDENDSITSVSGTLEHGGTLNLQLTNDYEYDKGTLKLYKTVSCTNWDKSTTVPDSMKDNITFTITGPDGYRETHSYREFTNGELELRGLDIGEYTITETNNVTGYTWTYKVNNATSDTPSATVQIKKDETATASFENNYVQKTANLIVKKTASGGATVPANTEFKVTFPDGKTVRTFKYSDMTDGKYVFNNVPLGTYKVEEIDDTAKVTNYSLKVTGEGNVVLADADTNKTAEIKNTYTGLGSIKVAKTIAGDLDSSKLTDAQKKAIKFTIYNSSNKSVGTLTYADILAGKGTISNLPVGTYTITETVGNISGYTLATVPSNKRVTVDVTKGETVTGYFKNTYTKDEYKLTVNKVFGDGSAYNGNDLPENIRKNTKFDVIKNRKIIVTCTYDELASKLNGLIMGDPGPYIIRETNPTVEGYGISTSVSKNGGNFGNGKEIQVTLKNHETTTVTFKNTYTPQGTINGDKTVVGLPSYEEEGLRDRIEFFIYRKSNGEYSLYKSVTLEELEAGIVVPAGEYYVKEDRNTTGVPGYTFTVNAQVNNGDIETDDSTDVFTVTAAGTVSVHFKNTYELDENNGELGLIKKVEGLDGLTGKTELTEALDSTLYRAIKFKIEERLNNKWYELGTFSLGTLINEGVALRPGHYRITELSAGVNGYKLFVRYKIGASDEISGDKAEFDIAANEELTIEVSNIYTRLGNLTITKEIKGDLISTYKTNLTEAERKKIKFTVTGPFGFNDTFTFNDIWNTGSKTYNNIPVGEYTVKEEAEDTLNYNLTVSCDHTEGKVPVDVNRPGTIKFTNTYNHKLGSLTIKKTLAGDFPASMTEEQKKAMSFAVKDSSGVVKYTATYDQFVNGEYTITDMPIGKYTVVESVGKVITDDYLVEITGDNKKPVTVGENSTAVAEINNKFIQAGNLKLVKTFKGTKIPDDKKAGIQFSYWMINDNGEKIGEETIVNFSDFVNGVYTSPNLKAGRYAVAELDDTTGYSRITTVKVNDGEVVNATTANTDINFGETSTVTFNNTYSQIASLKVTKSIAGDLGPSDLTEAQKKAIRFTVKSVDKTVDTFTYFDMTDGYRVINNLVPGEYTVTETITDDEGELFGKYSCVTQFKIGNSAAVNRTVAQVTAVHGENIVSFINTYDKIEPLHVEKSSSVTRKGMVEKDGAKYPVWEFTLNISNMNPLTTKDGTTTFSDVFDTQYASWFRLATAEEVAEATKSQDNKNAYITSLVAGKAAPTAVYNESDNTIVITGITENTADKCTFTYYLIIKDRETLNQLNAPATVDANGVERYFKNKLTYRPMPNEYDVVTVDADYEYKFTAVTKGISNLDEQGNLYDIINGEKVLVNYADYYVTLNEDGVTIGDKPTITAIDKFSENQIVRISSIETEPSEGVSYKLDNENHMLEFTIPNGKPVNVSYRIDIIDSENANVQLVNDIALIGFKDVVNKVINCSTGGDGEGEIYYMNLIKVDALDNSNKLEGVKFSLYDGETNTKLTTKETDKNGHVQFKYWENNGSFKLDHNYYLVEEAACEGYNLNKDKIWLRISKTETPGVAADKVNVLISDGELLVTNEPVTATLAVTKNFNNWNIQREFKFKLKPVGSAPMPEAGGEIALTTEDESTGTFGIIRFDVDDNDFANGKVVTYNYNIQEIIAQADMVDGIKYDTTDHPVTVTISDNDNNGIREVDVTYGEGARSLTVTNVYETVEVSGTKTWDDANNQDGIRPEKITINLLADGEKVASKEVSGEGNTWSWSFTNLPRYSKGNEIAYTVTEEEVEGYKPEINGFNVKNTHVPEKTVVSGTKTWDDANNQDGKRPQSITINLLADGEKIDSQTVSADDKGNWNWSFTDLPKYKAGKLIKYTITEDAVTGYTTAYLKDTFDVTNSHTPETIEVSGTKKWEDANNQDGIRPQTITINLLADGTVVDTQEVSVDSDGIWRWSFTGLPKYKAGEVGQKIVYSITEENVTGYTAAYPEGTFNVTNSHTPETVAVSGTKTWVDANNQDGKRPEKITINLFADGEKVASKEVSGSGDTWNWSFTNLPKYKAGKLIEYTITEDVVEWYTTEINGFNVKNTHEPEKTAVSGSKKWEDANNQDGKRPDTITINLFADGEKIDSKTVSADEGNWSWSFTDLPKYKAGKLIEYTITEDAVTGYTAAYPEGTFNVTNSHTPETVAVSGTKTWVDANNQDGKRPQSITINLFADGEKVDSKSVSGSGDTWEWIFRDLPKYKAGKLIEYTITEDVVEWYTTEINGYSVTNTHVPELTEVSGIKDWDDAENQDGIRPQSITINLLADGEKIDSQTVIADDEGNWNWSFTGLPKYKAGKLIEYTITEDAVEGYKPEINGFNVKNTHIPEETEVSGTKKWEDAENQDGKRPDTIIINLFADGEKIDSQTVSADDEGNWSWSFTNLPKFKVGKVGQEVVYSITEDEVDEYETVINGYNVTNKHEPELVEVSGTKTWDDEDNQDGKRPATIIINLLADGEKIDSRTVTAEDDWSWKFTGLPKYKEGKVGQIVVYSITEEAVNEYETTIDGYDVTNKHEPEKTFINVTKVWSDRNNKEGKRPKSITVVLLADGEVTDRSLVLNKGNNWQGTFDDLDVYKAGEKIVYTVAEVRVPKGYKSEITGTAEYGFVIINKFRKPPVPDTGDSSNPLNWIVLNLISGISLIGIFGYRRRKKSR